MTANRVRAGVAIVAPAVQTMTSMVPEAVVAEAVDALQSMVAPAVVAADMVAVVPDAELSDRPSCGRFRAHDEGRNCHSDDCECCGDGGGTVVDHTTRSADGHRRRVGDAVCYWLNWFGANADNNNIDCVMVVVVVVVVAVVVVVVARAGYGNGGGGDGVDGGGAGCRNDWILVQTIYYYCVYRYLMHAPMHSEWKWW